MKLLLETFDENDNLNKSRVLTQEEPDWKLLTKKAKKLNWKTSVKKENGKVVRYEEQYPYEMLGTSKSVYTVLER